MFLPNTHAQQTYAHLYDASGTIATGGTAQIVLPRQRSRSSFIFVNNSAVNMYLEFGPARAGIPVLSSQTVSSVPVANAGMGYSRVPVIRFYGGAFGFPNATAPTYTVQGTPDLPSPSHPAMAHCVMTGSAGAMTVSSIVIDDPGVGYLYPPYAYIQNDELDPFGSAVPSVGTGILLLASGGSYTSNGTVCVTDAVSVYCATTGSAFSCKYSL